MCFIQLFVHIYTFDYYTSRIYTCQPNYRKFDIFFQTKMYTHLLKRCCNISIIGMVHIAPVFGTLVSQVCYSRFMVANRRIVFSPFVEKRLVKILITVDMRDEIAPDQAMDYYDAVVRSDINRADNVQKIPKEFVASCVLMRETKAGRSLTPCLHRILRQMRRHRSAKKRY